MLQRRLLTRTLQQAKKASSRNNNDTSSTRTLPLRSSSGLGVHIGSLLDIAPAATRTIPNPLLQCRPITIASFNQNSDFCCVACPSPLSQPLSSLSAQRRQDPNSNSTTKRSGPSLSRRHQLTTRRNKVFVSKHNQSLNVTANQITDYCSNHGIGQDEFRVTNSHVVIRECPFCEKPTHGKADNMFKIYVQIGGGAYFCHRCGAKGSWYDFKMRLGGYEVTDHLGRSPYEASSASAGGTGTGGVSVPSKAQYQRTYNNGGSNNNGNGKGYGNQYNNGSRNSLNTTNSGRGNNQQPLPMPSQRLQAAYITNLLESSQKNASASEALQYLTETRGLTKQTLRKYGVGLGSYNFPSNEPGKHGKYVRADCVTFPWIMRSSEVNEQELLRDCSYNWEQQANVDGGDGDNDSDENRDESKKDMGPFVTRRIKARALNQKAWQRLDPPGGGWGLFGWHTVPSDATEIVLTEGEYDAMAVHQATGRPAVSLPNGCRSLPVEVLPMLERFETIYLWMDNDGPGREGAEQFANKIGVNRCLIVHPKSSVEGKAAPKDANEALLQGMNLGAILDESAVLPHERILTFADIRNEVLHEMLNPEKYSGVKVPSLPQFTNIIKGFRRGELTVLTGPTGSGKTTLLGQLSLDFAEQGVNTLWGSFEIKNTRLLHKLLQQYSHGPLPLDRKEKSQALEVIADRFENLPMYFMKFHGGSDIDDVLDAMEYAAYVHDVQHIILDNMQFMISRNSPKYNSSFDKFEIQDIAIEKFRKFATSKNIHITLVCHPRKEEEGMKLGLSSVYGSAKATQEADNVVILQKDPTDDNRKYIDVKKNRYDGTLGMCPLYFHQDSKRYAEAPEHQLPPANQPRANAKAGPARVPMVGNRSFVSAAAPGPAASPNQVKKKKPRSIKSTYSSILEN